MRCRSSVRVWRESTEVQSFDAIRRIDNALVPAMPIVGLVSRLSLPRPWFNVWIHRRARVQARSELSSMSDPIVLVIVSDC